MGYQLYEILLLFSIYSIIGWMIGICSSALTQGRFENHGICKGPYCPSYGAGVLLILYAMEYLDLDNGPVTGFFVGMALGTFLELVVMVCINGLCGGKLIRFKWYHPPLFGAGSVILVCHLNPLLTVIMRSISPWIHLAFLILFWMYFASQFIDGISKLMEHKKKITIPYEAE